jgi:hypothetical protein
LPVLKFRSSAVRNACNSRKGLPVRWLMQIQIIVLELRALAEDVQIQLRSGSCWLLYAFGGFNTYFSTILLDLIYVPTVARTNPIDTIVGHYRSSPQKNVYLFLVLNFF